MPVLRTQRDFRAVQNLGFCYLCARLFVGEGEDLNHDHVPPRRAFHVNDRQPPLKLRTHSACNGARSAGDDQISQLIGLLRGEPIGDRKRRPVRIAVNATRDSAALINLNLDDEIWRWVRAFHAALYHEPLVLTNERALEPPLPRSRVVNGVLTPDALRPQHQAFVETIVFNRERATLDVVACYNDKCRYECVWVADVSQTYWFCVFALELHGWKNLGAAVGVTPRACVGCYLLADRQPPARGTRGEHSPAPMLLGDPNDPFA